MVEASQISSPQDVVECDVNIELDVEEEYKEDSSFNPLAIENVDDVEGADDDDEGELFNPQEIDFSEVERLREKVATLEQLLLNQG